jgi:hypothetical protein
MKQADGTYWMEQPESFIWEKQQRSGEAR